MDRYVLALRGMWLYRLGQFINFQESHMSTLLVKAAADGVRAFSSDPVVKQLMVQLSTLLQSWFSRQGYEIEVCELFGDYLLHGNLGKQSVLLQLRKPADGAALRVVCELRTLAQDATLCAWLQLRRASNGPWATKDSAQVRVHYGDHPGSYKMQLVTKQLRALLDIAENVLRLEDTAVPVLLQAVMDEVELSDLA